MSIEVEQPGIRAIPEPIRAVIDQLREKCDQVALPRAIRLKVATAVRNNVVPKLKASPRRKSNHVLDAAFADYKSGIRGLPLFSRHIRNYASLSRWRRKVEQDRLLNALHKRVEREKKQAICADQPRRDGQTGVDF